MTTLYWHDYETWGVNPAIDRPAQFAGLRTDEDLNILGEPLVIYCKPAEDVLPHPEACLVTGIAPQKAETEGLVEAEFIRLILAELGRPGTCGVGYNTLRFDDEVTRYTLYRNFFDPYEREWKNGNSRWDIIDLTRACYALRPEGIEWPIVEGVPSFRLELLTQANGISHTAAHDALADVEATIKMAQLIKTQQPALYQHVYSQRGKKEALAMFDWQTQKPLVHVSSMFGAKQGCLSLVMPLAMHPVNKNAVIVVDLTASPEDLIRLPAEEVSRRVFTRQDELSDGEKRIPLKLVHMNKSPILFSPNALTSKNAARLGIDLVACERHWQALLKQDLKPKVQAAMATDTFAKREDPEQKLYDGFIPNSDHATMLQLRDASANELASKNFVFKDPRLQEMVWRYKARNYPSSLNKVEQAQWFEFCQQRLKTGSDGVLSIAVLGEKINQLMTEENLDKNKKIVLQQLQRYAASLAQKYEVGKKCQW